VARNPRWPITKYERLIFSSSPKNKGKSNLLGVMVKLGLTYMLVILILIQD
jgi:hypothetical protein